MTAAATPLTPPPAAVANFSARDDFFLDISDITRRYVITCGEVGSARGRALARLGSASRD